MEGYVYISNSTKVNSSEDRKVKLTNMSQTYLAEAIRLGKTAYMGVDTIPENVVSECDVIPFKVGIYRNPFAFKDNYKAYKVLTKTIKENNIQYIHCNTPVGGILGRFAGRKCKVKKIIYQVHGFHFYKGCPLLNKLMYYPIECFLSHFTDAIITINTEDFEAAKKLKLRNKGKVYYVHGVGIDTKDYQNVDVDKLCKRKELNVKEDDFVLLSVGRLDANKNNQVLIKAVAEAKESHIKLVLCGDGEEREKLEELAKSLGVEEQIVFLGNRTDMKEIYSVADCLLMASFREGLSRTIMEAMSAGLPCIVSKIRGNVDLIEDGVNGYLCSTTDYIGFANAIKKIISNTEIRINMSKANLEKIKNYDISVVEKEIKEIYNEVFS